MDYSENVAVALALTTLAGLSTALGGLIVVFFGKPTFVKLGHMLSFSSGVMLFISFIDLMPEAMNSVGFGVANTAFFVGFGLFWLIVHFVPEPDPAELVKKAKGRAVTKKMKEQQNLLYVGMLTALGISLHNFPEGVAVFLISLQGVGVALPLAVAIAAHNIPEGMAVAGPVYHATGSRWEAFKWSFISGMCEPLGAIIIGLFFTQYLTPEIIKTSLAGVAGIMVFMCFHELIPQSLRYISSDAALYSNVGGMIFISLSVWFLQERLGFKTP